MKVLLTGITGNLGFEIAQCLMKRGIEVVPVVRDSSSLGKLDVPSQNVIQADLLEENPPDISLGVDYIIHSAGNVHFEKSEDSNTRMMHSVIHIAKQLDVPLYYISTAFLWRESGNVVAPRNQYEIDKLHSEEVLADSYVPHTIFRPSVLVGHSQTGMLNNWTGYYILVKAFLEAVKNTSGSKIRFPLLTGTSNMIPVDQAAEAIVDSVIQGKRGELVYLTNPTPPQAQWVLETTLDFFGVREAFEFVDMDFIEYSNLTKTPPEEILSLMGAHFSPYWSLHYTFPASAITTNAITEEYLQRTLRSFQNGHLRKTL
jgi:nucleoside-diphosphate-sugar epimerase